MKCSLLIFNLLIDELTLSTGGSAM